LTKLARAGIGEPPAWTRSVRRADGTYTAAQHLGEAGNAWSHLSRLYDDLSTEAASARNDPHLTALGRKAALGRTLSEKRTRLQALVTGAVGSARQQRDRLRQQLAPKLNGQAPDWAAIQAIWRLPDFAARMGDSTLLGDLHLRAVEAGDIALAQACEQVPRSLFPTGGLKPETRQQALDHRLGLLRHDQEIGSDARRFADLQAANDDVDRLIAGIEAEFTELEREAGMAPDTTAQMAAGQAAE
jgi:hypothetical protein